MTDFKLPDLPSDDELGITGEDRESRESPPDAPELTPEEQRALGLDDQAPSKPPRTKKPPRPPKPPKAKKPPRPPEPSGPRSRWRGPVTLLVLAVAAFLSSSYRTLPSPVAANAPDTAFSSARAMSMDVAIAGEAHPTGSPAHTDVREYIVARLRELGLDPQVQTATVMLDRDTHVRVATLRNIVARIPGTQSTGAILLAAHYDGAGIAHAAADDGAGVVSVLEAVRALRAGAPPRNDVIVLITDGDELGLMGAKAFADEHPWMSDVSVVLNVEMRGSGGPSLMFQTGAQSGWIVRQLKDADVPGWTNSILYEVYERMPNDTDFSVFKEASKQGLNFAAVGRASVYHQAYDTPANLSEATLQAHGVSLLKLTRALGAADLGQVDSPDVTYFTLPGLGLIVYPAGLVFPITAWMLLLAALVLVPVLRGAGRWPGLVAGFGIGAVSAAATGAVGFGLMRWLPRFHPEYGALVGSAFHHEGWYVLTLAGAGLFFTTALFGIGRRWFMAPTLIWGALLLPLAGGVFLTVKAPAGAMDLQWPVIAAYLAATALLLIAGPRTRTIGWIVSLILTIPVLAFLVPITELLWLAMSFSAAMVLGVVIVVALLLLLPALEWLREPNGWWAPLLSLAFAGACLGLGIRAAAPTPDRPAPSTLAWAYDRATGEALWVTDGKDSTEYEPAAAWATAHAGASFTATRSLDAFGYRPGARVATATPPDVAPLEVWVISDSVANGARHMRLALRSAIGAEMLQFRFPPEGATRLVAVNDKALPVGERATVVEHWGVPDPAVMLDLELPEGAAVDMDVVEHLLHPGALLGADHFQRPPDLAPDVTWQSDRAMVRTPAASLPLQYGPPPFTLLRTDTAPGMMISPDLSDINADSTSVPAVPDTMLTAREGVSISG